MSVQTSLLVDGSHAVPCRSESSNDFRATVPTRRLGPDDESEGQAPSPRLKVESRAPETDSAAPFKRRRRSASETAPKVSMLGLRDLWLMPLLAEFVLLCAAGWLSFCLLRLAHDPHAGFPLSSVLLLAAAYAGLAFYSRIHELFLPRKVVLLGVGSLALIATVASIAVMSDAYLVGGRSGAMRAALVLTPLHLFILRCLLIFREARFTPAADKLAMRLKCRAEKAEAFRRKLRFWLS